MNKLSDFYANRDTINGWYIDKQDCLRVKDYAEAGVPQGKALPGTATASRSATYVNGLSTGLPISQNVYGIKTGHDMFEVAVSRFPKQNCLGHREYDAATKRWSKYVWQTYETVSRRRNNVAAGLMHLYSEFTKKPNNDVCVGIMAKNRPEWMIADLACMSQSLVLVALYDTLGVDAVEYIIKHANIELVLCAADHIPTLLALRERLPDLKVLVSLDSLDSNEHPAQSKRTLLTKMANSKNVRLLDFAELESIGSQYPRAHSPPNSESTWTINYTSGTTGNPKGVLLKHRALVGEVFACEYQFNTAQVVLSFLPVAHCYERSNDLAAVSGGRKLGYYHGEVLELLDDFQTLQPDFVCLVPRVWNKLYATIYANTIEAPGISGALSRRAYAAKLARYRATGDIHHPFWDAIWTRKISRLLGGRLKHAVSGSAPISPSVLEFLQLALGCEIVVGYGLTETNAGCTVMLAGDTKKSTAGPPAFHCEICLESVPDMNYLITDKPNPRGEILVRGATMFSEYYKEPEKTAEVLEKDGWFHTGDIGSIDEEGRLSIIDRKKNLFKLAQGEYVSPEKIENIYAEFSIFQQVFVYGNSYEQYLVCVFGVNPDAFCEFASEVLGRRITRAEDVLDDEKVKHAIKKRLRKLEDRRKLNGFERVREFVLKIEPFTAQNDTITPTMKLKRPQAAKAFEEEIKSMYNVLKSVKVKL